MTAAEELIGHAPSCLRLLIVVTTGYAVTVHRCDECGGVATVRHCWPAQSPSTTTREKDRP